MKYLHIITLCTTLSNASTLFAMQEYGHRNGDDAGIKRTTLKLSILLNTYKQDLDNNPKSRWHMRQASIAGWALSDFNNEIQKTSYEAALDTTYEKSERLLGCTNPEFVNGLKDALFKPLDTN